MKKIVSVLCGVAFGISTMCAATPEWALYGVESDSEFHEGLAVFWDSNNGYKRGAINTSGEVVIPAKFESLSDFENGMAKASLDGKLYGIVNTKGQWLLEPKYSIDKEDDYPGVYELRDEEDKRGLFYNGRIVLPVEYKSVYTHNFPFLKCKEFRGESFYLNLVTGERYDYVIKQGDLFIANPFGTNKAYYKKNGEKINISEHNVSSKGLTPFKDEVTNKFGLKNVRTGEIAVPAKYEVMDNIWINDVIIARVSFGASEVLISADGKELFADKTEDIQIWLEGRYVRIAEEDPQYYFIYGLYDLKGNELLPIKYLSIYQQEPYGDWFCVKENADSNTKLYNAKRKKMYDSGSYSDGMFLVYGEKRYYINAETGEILDKNFEEINPFSEGLAKVRFKGRDYYDIIDKRGNVVLYGSKSCEFYGDFFLKE